ncbi:MFS transporter [Alkalicoccobacillus gibsonii]|uniref:MFS transporter n=1 Tax=Alkalicoccobacillus gibsonii TaxID=79881 RepID=UPI003F7B4544
MANVESKKLFQNKGYVYIIAAQTLSSLGSWLDMLALMGLVALKWNASPLEMSGAMLMLVAPMVLLAPIAGVLADRFERKHIMIISNVVCIVLVLGIAFSTALWQVYALLFVRGFFETLFGPAKSGKVKEIVGMEHIQAAMGISGMIDNASKIIGPFLSGLLVAVIGIQGSFITNAVVVAVSTLLLLKVPTSLKTPQKIQSTKRSWVSTLHADLREGYLFLRSIPVVLISVLLLSFMVLALQIADTQIIILLRELFTDPTKIMGYGIACAGAGTFLSSAYYARKKIRSTLTILLTATLIMGLVLISVALLRGLPVSVLFIVYPALFFIMGFSIGAVSITTNILAQKQTPVDKTGRVFGFINSLTTFGMLLGIVTGGLLSEGFGVVVAFILSGSLLIILGLVTIPVKYVVERRHIHVSESIASAQGKA